MTHLYRKIIRVTAEDSPNVRLALAQRAAGKPITGETLIPGVLSYADYVKRRSKWDIQRQTEGLDARFYVGPEIMLFPPENLAASARRALELRSTRRVAKAIGVDSGQGVANTSWTAVDELGVIEQVSKRTLDTSVITGDTVAFGRKHSVPDSYWMFDVGGGGLEHADRLRSQGYKGVRTVGFGESVTAPLRRGMTTFPERVEAKEERYAYLNRRAEMYHTLSLAVATGWAIGADLDRLHFQLSKMPKKHDGEGRIWLPPKNKKDANDTRKTLVEIIGYSPDEADSCVVAYYCMTSKPIRRTAGAT